MALFVVFSDERETNLNHTSMFFQIFTDDPVFDRELIVLEPCSVTDCSVILKETEK